jgi:Cu/Ag efflux pump CusA
LNNAWTASIKTRIEILAVPFSLMGAMVGGVMTSTLMELLVFPAIFYLWHARAMQKS